MKNCLIVIGNIPMSILSEFVFCSMIFTLQLQYCVFMRRKVSLSWFSKRLEMIYRGSTNFVTLTHTSHLWIAIHHVEVWIQYCWCLGISYFRVTLLSNVTFLSNPIYLIFLGISVFVCGLIDRVIKRFASRDTNLSIVWNMNLLET